MFQLVSALYMTVVVPLRHRLRRDDGLEAIEYALIAALLGVVIVAAINLLGPAIQTAYETIAGILTNPTVPVESST